MTTGNDNTLPANTTPPPNPGDPNPHLHRARLSTGRFTRDMATVRRDAAVAEYLADHPETTYEQLAQRFGFSHKTDARNAVLRARADVARPAVTKLIQSESEELDALYAEACKILQRNHVTVSHGKVIMLADPETGEEKPLLDDGPKLQAIQVAIRVRESYRKLHGLDQPAKTEVSGGVKYEVVGIDPSDLT